MTSSAVTAKDSYRRTFLGASPIRPAYWGHLVMVIALLFTHQSALAGSGECVVTGFGRCKYQEVTWLLNDAQLAAAPKDSPGVKTVSGYFSDVIITDSKGTVITGADETRVLQSFRGSGVEEKTVWLGDDESQPTNHIGRVVTWRAAGLMNQEGKFFADTVIVGDGRNLGREEKRKATDGTTPPQLLSTATTNQIQTWVTALKQQSLDTNAFYSILAVGPAAVPLLEKCIGEENPPQMVRASELLLRICGKK